MSTDFLTAAEVAIHGDAVAGRAHHVRTQLETISKNIKLQTFDLAELLTEAKQNNLYGPWGYSSIAHYASEELGLKSSKTHYLIRIVEVCQEVGVERGIYELAGISKLRDITSLDPKGTFYNDDSGFNEELGIHILRLIEEAPTMTAEQVSEEVARLKGFDEEDKLVVRSYSVSKEAWEKVVKPAFEMARMRLGSKGRDEEGKAIEYTDGVCIESICADFLSDPHNTAEVEHESEIAF